MVTAAARRLPAAFSPRTAAGKRRVIGIALLLAILAPFAALNRLPKLDTVRADMAAATSADAECFQGFCVEADPESTFWSRWWRFSTTYLRLVAIGMAFAFAAAGLAEAFLAPGGGQAVTARAGGRLRRILAGLGLGPVVNLCSACVVPVSGAVRRGGLGVEGALALVHGSAVLNAPSLLMIAAIFSPSIGVSRVLLGAAAAFLLGPLVAAAAGRTPAGREAAGGAGEPVPPSAADPTATWGQALAAGLPAWARASGRMAARMGPIMVAAGLVSGAAIQVLRPEMVQAFLGDDLAGVLVAATLGVLINVPLLFEIPLVTVLLLLGAGAGPAAALLFAAAAGGPVTFWGLSRVIPWRGIGAYAAGTWVIAAAGGLLVLAAGALLPDRSPLRLHGSGSGERAASGERATGSDERAAASAAAFAPPAVVSAGEASGDGAPARLPPLRFTDVSVESGVSGDVYHSRSAHSLGVNWIDVDRDGRPDLFAVGGDPEFPPKLFRNLGGGRFEAAHHLIPELPAYEMSGSIFADYDNDGDSDIYLYTDRQEWRLHGSNAPDGPPNLLLKNLLMESGGRIPAGRPLFAEAAASAGVDDRAAQPFGELPAYRTKAAAWMDYDRDGCVDLYVAHTVMNRAGIEALRDRLYRNRCDGTFEPAAVAVSALRSGFTVLAAHLDGDLWPDLYVANVSFDLAWPHYWDHLYRNRNGVLVELPREAVPGVGDDAQAAMGMDVADVNLDGRWDLYISDLFDGTPHERPPWGNALYLGGEEALFGDNAAPEAGVAGDDSWGVNFFDADHDGWEDLYVATMMGAASELFYANDGDGTFTNVADGAGYVTGDSRGSAVADYDGDGDLDLAVVNQHVCGDTRPACSLQLLRNDTPAAGNWLQIRLTGTRSNRDAIGAVVRVRAGGLAMMRQVKGGSGGHSQSDLTVHFGLGPARAADVVEVDWPSGLRTRWRRQEANRLIDVIEGQGCRAGGPRSGDRPDCSEAALSR